MERVMTGKRVQHGVTFAVLSTAPLAYSLLQSLVLPALPTLERVIHTSSTLAWLLTAFLLSAAVATPIVGRLGDMFGKEKMLVGCWRP
jgi:MFS family permease